MWELLKNIFSPTQYMPHGHCYLWQTPLVWLHITGDFLIAIAYFSIPAMLIYFVVKRRDIPFLGIFALFGAFIILCGTGHLLDIWTLWNPAYWLSGAEKGITALVSCVTAGQMITLLPQFLSLKTPQELEEINSKLQAEILVRQNVELALRSANENLEAIVEKRTAELREINSHLELEIKERIAVELALRHKRDRLKEQQHSLLELARSSSIYEGDIEAAFREITQIATQTLKIERGSIWFYNQDKSVINCAALYELSTNKHSCGSELRVADYPLYFQALNTEEAIVAPHANNDPQTQELSQSYLIPLGISAMLDIPIIHQGQVIGVICLEHQGTPKDWTLDEQNFASYLAQITALALESHDRKQAESKLRSATERLQHLLAVSPAVIVSRQIGGDYAITFMSENIVSILGYGAQEFLANPNFWGNLVHPEDKQLAFDTLGTILTKEFVSYEYRIQHKNGNYIWAHVELRLVKDATGLPIECVGYAVDISERQAAQRERDLAQAALQQQLKRERLVNSIQERIRSSLNQEEVLIMTVKEVRQFLATDRTIIYRFNSDWSGFVEVESVAPGIKSILGIDINDPCFQERYVTVYQQGRISAIDNIETSKIAECHIHLLNQFEIKANLVVPILQGEKLWGLLIAHHCRSPRSWHPTEIESLRQISIQLAIGIKQSMLFEQANAEIAERKVAEIALQKAVEEADTANQAKSEFLSSMSHELRTPLNAILGFTQVMVRDSSLKSQHQQYLEIINRAGEHLLSLINEILEMSKIEAGQIQLNESDFNLKNLLGILQDIFIFKAETKQLQLVIEVAENVPQFVKGDEGKLRQVLINILGNAIKFTETGSVTLRVNLLSEDQIPSSTVTIQFEVEDTGLGIAPEEMDKLFEPFGQTKTGLNSQQGTGLGLPISRKFVQLMGGDIIVSSIPEVGSKFAFAIKMSLVDQNQINLLKPQGKIIGLAPNQPEYRILVVDDHFDNRLALVQLLSPLGLIVREASNGQEAITIWQDWHPHLIWMDIRMPVMNGYEATNHIKAHPLGKETIIIALSASVFAEERKTILAAGCDDFLCKPFEANLLLTKMAELLGIHYIYEESVVAKIDPNPTFTSSNYPSVESQLCQMSPEWLEKIYHASHECYEDNILKLIEEIPEEISDSAQILTDLVNNFRFDDILEIIEKTQYLQNQN